jgi:diguanylate cyclase (GGDEF)-like protein
MISMQGVVSTSRNASTPFGWMGRLADAGTPREVAAAIVYLAQAEPGCKSATVFWNLAVGGEPQHEPPAPLGDGNLELVHSAAASGLRTISSNGSHIAIPLFQTNLSQANPAILLIAMDAPAATDLHGRANVAGGRMSEAAQRFLDSTTTLLHMAGRHLYRALELTRLKDSLAGLERSELLQRSLFAISDLAGSDCDMPELLKGIHAIVDSLMYAKNCFIVRLDNERQLIRFLYFVDTVDPYHLGEFPLASREGTLTWWVLTKGKPLRGSNEELNEQVSGQISFVGSDSYVWMGVPMLREGVVEGAIVVQSYEPGIVYTADDQAVLEFVGSHILTALERKNRNEDLERSVEQRTLELADANKVLQLEIVERQRAERLQAALFHIAQLATAEISQSEFYPRVHAEVGELINAKNFFIALLSDDGQTLTFPYAIDESGDAFEARPLGRGLSEYVLKHGQSIFRIEDIVALTNRGEIDLDTVGAPALWWLGVPLLVGDEVIGLIAVQSYDPDVVYGPADQSLLSFVASQIANTLHRRRAAENLQKAYAQLESRVQERTQELREEIAERQRIQEQLKHQVMHDALTGLPNRGYLLDRLTRVLNQLKREPERRCALLYLDIDRFKVINDSLGHLAGDVVLKEVSRRLLTCVREPDVVARLSGDEFAILLEDVEIPSTAVKVAQRIIKALKVTLPVAGKELEPSASIGIAIGDSRYVVADEVLKDADTALYRAKELGRNRFELFDESLQKSAVNVLAMEGELRLALQHDQFEPYFQPIVRLATREIVGYEALIRWNHPTRGVIGPADFLQIAESSGNIEAIDWRMFELSCSLAEKLGHARTFLTINVSPLHFKRVDFDTRLLDLLRRTGLSTARLLTEVTEGSLLGNPERVCATLGRLQTAGVGAALDDFGTGYSSLNYLHKFPLRMLKIDRAFVSELGNSVQNTSATVIAAMLSLAGALGMQVVAEGIETQEELDALLAMGCEFGQGYLLGRPAPIDHWAGAKHEAH